MPAIANSSPRQVSSGVVQLRPRAEATVRPVEAIQRDIEQLSAALSKLGAELAVMASCGAHAPAASPAPAGEVLSLQRAAHAIGWAVPRLRRHIVRHNREFPHDQLAYQPGGRVKTEWSVPMARLHRYVLDQRPLETA